MAESAAYSVLQSGPEFAAWRGAHAARVEEAASGPRVQVVRDGDVLSITMTRPDRLNALDAAMRDGLVEAFTLAAAAPDIARVELRGEGRAFCAGGDLDEFGSRSDPATAHLIRLERSIGRMIFELDKPTVTYLHGACMGSGIELAAFTDWVVAAPDTQIALPEIGLGLVPGAGGTVSLTRRIGRLAHGVARVLREHHRCGDGAGVGTGRRTRRLTVAERAGERASSVPVYGFSPADPPWVSAVTLVHSGEGREVMTRPLGPTKVSSALASPDIVQPLRCTMPW